MTPRAAELPNLVPAMQTLSATGEDPDRFSLTVSKLGPTSDGGIILFVSFSLAPDRPWIPDEPLRKPIYLSTDSERARLLTATGTAAAPASGEPIRGWYIFAPLHGDPATLTLHYDGIDVPLPITQQPAP